MLACEPCVTELQSEPVRHISIGETLSRAAEYFGFTERELISNSRKREYVFARQLLMRYFRGVNAKLYTHKRIGEILGGRDHTTTIHGLQVLRDLVDAYGMEVVNIYNEMTKFIKANGTEERNTMDWSDLEYRPWLLKSGRRL